MPQIAKWAADFMETAFSSKFRDVTIAKTEYLHPKLKKITFSGDLSKVKFGLGYAILIRVDDTRFRNYTPCFWDGEAGIFEVLFHLHGNGPASEYVSRLQAGDALHIATPRGFTVFRKEAQSHFFFGDETTLGVFESFMNAANELGAPHFGIFELDRDAFDVPAKLGLRAETVQKTSVPAENAVKALRELGAVSWESFKNGHFYLAGNAKSIQQFRKALRELGIVNKQIFTQPYWAEGKIGL